MHAGDLQETKVTVALYGRLAKVASDYEKENQDQWFAQDDSYSRTLT